MAAAGREAEVPAAPQLPRRKSRFRINRPIMVLAIRDGHRAAVIIQAGEIIEVTGPAEDDRFVAMDVRGE